MDEMTEEEERKEMERRARIKSSIRLGLLWEREDDDGSKILVGTLRHPIRLSKNRGHDCPMCDGLLSSCFGIYVKSKNPPKEGQQPSDHGLYLEQRNAEVGDCEIKLVDLHIKVDSDGESWFVGKLNEEIEIRITPYGRMGGESEERGLPDYSICMYQKLRKGLPDKNK